MLARTKVVITIDTECREVKLVRGDLWPAAGFGAHGATWRAMVRCGFSVSSNYHLCSRLCRLRPPVATVDVFQATDNLLEVPIGVFAERDGFRPMQITPVSAGEMIRYLRY